MAPARLWEPPARQTTLLELEPVTELWDSCPDVSPELLVRDLANPMPGVRVREYPKERNGLGRVQARLSGTLLSGSVCQTVLRYWKGSYKEGTLPWPVWLGS